MAATFFSGFKDQGSALNYLLDKIYAGFQMQSSICVVLKDEEHCAEFKRGQKQKYFENAKIEYLYDDNIAFISEQPAGHYDEVHILSDKVLELPLNVCDNIFVYTTSADEEINKASRTLYANLKKNNIELNHKAI
jgi:hypothetical protein|tara:strand:- start:1379 stop:1783 length:405 start_codon:yes stop_codon:yes gene_type:complete